MPNVLITGATDGIGLALARIWADRGARLVLIGRRPLADLADPIFTPTTYCTADLAQPDAPARIADFLAAQRIDALDLVVHNAGMGYVGDPAEQPSDSITALVQVNLTAPILLTLAVLPAVRRAHGRLLFVSSVAAAWPAPRYAVYGATKAALEGFARSLRTELAGEATVQVVRPGATRTGMHRKAGLAETALPRRAMSAEEVAQAIVRAAERPPRRVTVGLANRLASAVGVAAAPLVDAVLRRTFRRSAAAPPGGRPPHCVITGAADGIGRALALHYAAAGYRITGVDRDAARSADCLRALHARGADAAFIHADLSSDWEWAAQLEPVDLLIHNAGISAVGRWACADPAAQTAVVRVNLLAPLQITARLLAADRLTAEAGVIVISSLSHFSGYPGAPTYAASKDGLAHYARSLAVVLGPRRHVLTVFPGPTRTAHARRYSPDNRREQRRMPPEHLAMLIARAHRRRRRRLLPGTGAFLAAWFGRLLPRAADWAMRRAILDKLPPC